MSGSFVLHLAQEALLLTILLGAGPILAAVAVGLLVSVLQAATQVHEATVSFALKLCAMGFSLFLLGEWILGQLTCFTQRVFESLPGWVG